MVAQNRVNRLPSAPHNCCYLGSRTYQISVETEVKLFSPFFLPKPKWQGHNYLIRWVKLFIGCNVFIVYIHDLIDKIQVDFISVIPAAFWGIPSSNVWLLSQMPNIILFIIQLGKDTYALHFGPATATNSNNNSCWWVREKPISNGCTFSWGSLQTLSL